MAKLFENTKGFKIIEMSVDEAQYECGFGIPEGIICGHCNNLIHNDDTKVYYVCVLHETYCKDCLKEWLDTATYYPEDAKYENQDFEYVCRLLGLSLQK